MDDKELENWSSIDCSAYARELKAIAIDEYISARALYLDFSLRPARQLSHQAVEKILKAICFYCGIKIGRFHNVFKIYCELIKPLNVELCDIGMRYLSILGGRYTDLRYATSPSEIYRSEMWALDRLFLTLLKYANPPIGKSKAPYVMITSFTSEFRNLLSVKAKRYDVVKKTNLLRGTLLIESDQESAMQDVEEYFVTTNTVWDAIGGGKRISTERVISSLATVDKEFTKLLKKTLLYSENEIVRMGISEKGMYSPLMLKSFSFVGVAHQYSPPLLDLYGPDIGKISHLRTTADNL